MDIAELLYDDTNCNFKANSCKLAKLKFRRLLKKYPSSDMYSQCLIESSVDLKDVTEYEDFIQYLANPKQRVSTSFDPSKPFENEVIPATVKMLPEIFKKNGQTVVIDQESIKSIPNAVFIHIKNEAITPIVECDYESDDEKIMN